MVAVALKDYVAMTIYRINSKTTSEYELFMCIKIKSRFRNSTFPIKKDKTLRAGVPSHTQKLHLRFLTREVVMKAEGERPPGTFTYRKAHI